MNNKLTARAGWNSMCGLVGFWGRRVDHTEAVIERMTDQITHRGPDANGVWWDDAPGIALGHRRLAIIDLSEAGAQPMRSADGRFVIVYNGEIYNHRLLRLMLESEGVRQDWRGHSDTETLLAALAHWGIEPALKKMNGMFAFALWDRKQKVLTLARDRLGEKPLYYGVSNGCILFGSELKALVAHPTWQGEIDRDALALYLRYGYVPEPKTIYKGIVKLPPAHVVTLTAGAEMPASRSYWDLRVVVQGPRHGATDADLITGTETALMQSVGLRMEADVPLGAFLSGGVDSSVIVAMMQAQSDRPINTFTIGFDVPGFNEAESAKGIARHLGTHHTELYLKPQDVLNTVPSLPEIWDEPFADSSQLPTMLLSKLTRQYVKVALSGDGGDEVFGGYNRYARGFAMYRRFHRLPKPARRVAAALLRVLPVHAMDKVIARLPQQYRHAAIGDKLTKLADVLQLSDEVDYYHRLISINQDPSSMVIGADEPKSLVTDPDQWPVLSDFRECMMYLDAMTYLPGDIMTKVDRATMSVGLEGRAPFLDHDLIAHAWSLPMAAKIRGGETKWVLRRILERHVPSAMFERPKMGFGVPIEHWLEGALRPWAEALLDPVRLATEGFFEVSVVRKLWDDHVQGRSRNHHQLWTILMFQAWLSHQSQTKAFFA